MLRENASATATPCLENSLAKLLPEQNPFEKMMHTSPFVSSEPVLLEVAKSSEECNLEDTLHFCEDERSSLSSIEFGPPSSGLEYVVLNDDLSTMHLLRWRTNRPWSMRRRLWSPKRMIPHMSIGTSVLKYHKNHAHSILLYSQACLVPHAHMRNAITSRSFLAKSSGWWL